MTARTISSYLVVFGMMLMVAPAQAKNTQLKAVQGIVQQQFHAAQTRGPRGYLHRSKRYLQGKQSQFTFRLRSKRKPPIHVKKERAFGTPRASADVAVSLETARALGVKVSVSEDAYALGFAMGSAQLSRPLFVRVADQTLRVTVINPELKRGVVELTFSSQRNKEYQTAYVPINASQ